MHQKCANVETFDEHIKKVHEKIAAKEWLEVSSYGSFEERELFLAHLRK